MSTNKAYQFVKIIHSGNSSLEERPHKSMFYKIGLHNSCLSSKTAFCKHEFGCLENVLTDASKSFLYGYSIRMLISLVSLVAKAKTATLRKIFQTLVSNGNFKFGAFLGIMTLLMKGLICLLRIIRKKEDWKNSFFSGALAGYFSLFFIKSKSRMIFTTFFLSRAFDCYYNSLVKRKVIKDSHVNHVVIFMLLNGFTVYARLHEPYLCPPSLTRFYDFVFAKGPAEATLEHVLTEMTRRRLLRNNTMV